MEKTSGVHKCAWPRAYEWTESYRCIYVCLSRHKKSNLYLNSFWDIANLLFSIPLRMSDHIHLKWLNKFLTSMNSSPHAENQLYCSTHSWDETDSWFGITLGMSRLAWPHPLEMYSDCFIGFWTTTQEPLFSQAKNQETSRTFIFK